jgi:hypothetical protein
LGRLPAFADLIDSGTDATKGVCQLIGKQPLHPPSNTPSEGECVEGKHRAPEQELVQILGIGAA